MAIKKTTGEAKKAAPKKVAPAPKKAAPKKGNPYVSVKVEMYHPFQEKKIPTTLPGVDLIDDSWVQCQVDRGLLRKI